MRQISSDDQLGAAIKKILKTPKIVALIDQFTKYDNLALKHQKAFRRTDFYGRFSKTLESILRPLILIIAAIFLFPFETILSTFGNIEFLLGKESSSYAFIFEIVSLFIIITIQYIFVIFTPYENWQRARANAELTRQKLFNEVLQFPKEGLDETLDKESLLSLKLEYYRRFHLDVQLAYYEARSEELGKKLGSKRGWVFRIFLAIAILVAFFVTWLLVNFSDINVSPLWIERSFFGVSIFIVYFLGVSGEISTSIEDRRKHLIYSQLAQKLNELIQTELHSVRNAAAQGDELAVRQFATSVNLLTSSEFMGISDIEANLKA